MRIFPGTVLVLTLAVALCGVSEDASGSVWSKILRRSAQVPDDVPLSQTDDLAERLAKSPGLEDNLARRFPTLADEAATAGRKVDLLRIVRQAAPGLDENVLRQLDELDLPAKRAAVVLAEGGQRVRQTIPDIAARARFLRRGGSQTVAAVGLHGDEAARAALRLDTALTAGRLATPPGMRAATLKDFGNLMVRHGEAGWSFWKRYVKPHWKKWLAGGALTALLITPDKFIDAAGNLTEQGFQKLADLLGEAAAIAIRGTSDVLGTVVQESVEATAESFFSDWKGIYAAVGVLIVLTFLLPRPRWFVLGRLARLAGYGRRK